MEILTGNELLSGATVYLDRDGNWVEDLQQARLFGPEDKEAKEAAIAATKATMRINSLETETVTLREGVIHPDRIRERIRAEGPTTPRVSSRSIRRPALAKPTRSLRCSMDVEPNCEVTMSSAAWTSRSRSSPISGSISRCSPALAAVTPSV